MAELRVAEVTAPVLERLLAEKQQAGLSAQTVNHIRAAVSAIVTRSMEAGWWMGGTPPPRSESARCRSKCGNGSAPTR
jgi:hypothetical protein